MMIRQEEHNDLCVGIDLGTTNSVLATINVKPNGDAVSKVVEIPRAVDIYSTVSSEAKLTNQKKPTLPSFVYYREERNYEPLVGDFAKIQYALRPHLVAKSIKSHMGQNATQGLAADIPDKTPAQVSARILNHLLRQAEKIYRCEIKDAVITVPANFDSVMCKATRDAAELAGITVRNKDGSERPVLLSEPNAVIYDLINQIHNGEISNHIIDLSEKKMVLVFDLGGGTLDITMHEIKRREDCPEVLKVKEIATNRYTLLGGDDFDEEIAKTMFGRYLRQYFTHPDVVAKLKQEEKTIMPQLRNYAENLKLELSENNNNDFDDGWGEEEEDFFVGGNMGGIGYAYDDTFTKEEVEEILSVFMAEELTFEDYHKIDQIKNTRNIIYPILDVLYKASEKLGSQDVKVDAVIVNGGMSKFYMVTDRLTRFFGFEPIVALDPDQSVARGAAVYHHYLHKFEEMQEDMRMVGGLDDTPVPAESPNHERSAYLPGRGQPRPMAIEWGSNILNDSLYLGVKNGAVHKIIPTGAELPYQSEVMTGFKVMPGQSMISIPIKNQNIDGTYRTIAKGKIVFQQRYHDGAFVAFTISMASNKVIVMKAWTSTDVQGKEHLEEGIADIEIDSNDSAGVKTKILAPSGSNLRPKEEINNVLQLCKNMERSRGKNDRSQIHKRIAASVSSICSAGNREAFAETVLEAFYQAPNEEAMQRLFYIARKLAPAWNEQEKKRLANICMNQINAELLGLIIKGPKRSTNIQAMYTLSVCASPAQLEKLRSVHNNSKYLQVCLYVHGKTKTEVDWILQEFYKDSRKAKQRLSNNLQFSVYAIGMVLRQEEPFVVPIQKAEAIVQEICETILTGSLHQPELINSVLVLGWACDQRTRTNEIQESCVQKALLCIQEIEELYDFYIVNSSTRMRTVAEKMIHGEMLSEEEELYLLTKLEV